MSRSSVMTTGALLVLIGFQLNLVDTFVMTTSFTKFLNERSEDRSMYTTSSDVYSGLTSGTQIKNGYQAQPVSTQKPPQYPFNNRNYSSSNKLNYSYGTPATQASYGNPGKQSTASQAFAGPQKLVTPPSWICWPSIFLGAVIFLYGAAIDRR